MLESGDNHIKKYIRVCVDGDELRWNCWSLRVRVRIWIRDRSRV
jgi:hypothetical protein